ACSEALRQYLINHARSFIFSTALAPYVAVQTHASVEIVRTADDRRSRLVELSRFLLRRLQELRLDTSASQSHIVPVIFGSNDRALTVAARLVEAGFAVKAIRPPTVPQGTSRLRLSLTSRVSIE